MYERSSTCKAYSTPNQTLNQLKQGKTPIDHTLCLRGVTQDEAAKHPTKILAPPRLCCATISNFSVLSGGD